MLNRVRRCTPPFTSTRMRVTHLKNQISYQILHRITRVYLLSMYYACINILLYYHNIYYIGPYCNSVYILIVNCGETVRGRMPCILSCIYCILYYYDYNIPLLKPNAHKLYNMYHNTLSPWNTKMSVFTFPGIDHNLSLINKVLYSQIHYITHQNI